MSGDNAKSTQSINVRFNIIRKSTADTAATEEIVPNK